MVRVLVLSFLLVFLTPVRTKYSDENKRFPTQLLYDYATIRNLGKIADSLNRGFQNASGRPRYFSGDQAIGHYVVLNGVEARAAKQDIDRNIGFEEFRKKYPSCIVIENLLVLREMHPQGYDRPAYVSFTNVEMGPFYDRRVLTNDTTSCSRELGRKWVADYLDYGAEYIEAYYFTCNFSSTELPEKEAKLVGYVDRIIDTNSKIVTERQEGIYKFDTLENRKKKFANEAHNVHRLSKILYGKLNLPEKIMAGNEVNFYLYYSRGFLELDSIMTKPGIDCPEFRKIVYDAVDEAIGLRIVTPLLVQLAEKYETKDRALKLMRMELRPGCLGGIQPMGSNRNIAFFAAVTCTWDVFIRAHMGIVKLSMGAMPYYKSEYCFGSSHVEELERIHLAVPDLLLGSVFSVKCNKGHYSGEIRDLSKALSETSKKDEIELLIAQAIGDTKLDYNNRVRMCFLYKEYIVLTDDVVRKKRNIIAYNKLINTLPPYFAQRLAVKSRVFYPLW